MEDIIKDELEFYSKFTKPLIFNLPDAKDRVLAASWVKKIRDESVGTEKLRTDYLKLLLFALQRRHLVGIFADDPANYEKLDEFPPEFDLNDIAKSLVQKEQGERQNRILQQLRGEIGDNPPYITDCSSDFKEYVAAQDIPGFGVHCYYAISKEPVNTWYRAERGIFPKMAKSAVDNTTPVPPCAEAVATAVSQPSCVCAPKEGEDEIECIPKEQPPAPSPKKKRTKKLGKTAPIAPLGVVEPPEERTPPTWGSNLVEVTAVDREQPEPDENPLDGFDLAEGLSEVEQFMKEFKDGKIDRKSKKTPKPGPSGMGAGPGLTPSEQQLDRDRDDLAEAGSDEDIDLNASRRVDEIMEDAEIIQYVKDQLKESLTKQKIAKAGEEVKTATPAQAGIPVTTPRPSPSPTRPKSPDKLFQEDEDDIDIGDFDDEIFKLPAEEDIDYGDFSGGIEEVDIVDEESPVDAEFEEWDRRLKELEAEAEAELAEAIEAAGGYTGEEAAGEEAAGEEEDIEYLKMLAQVDQENLDFLLGGEDVPKDRRQKRVDDVPAATEGPCGGVCDAGAQQPPTKKAKEAKPKSSKIKIPQTKASQARLAKTKQAQEAAKAPKPAPKPTAKPAAKPPPKQAPKGSRVPPPGSKIAPPGSKIAPPGSRIAPPGSRIAPPGSKRPPPGSKIPPPGSKIRPPGSKLQPPTAGRAPPLKRGSPEAGPVISEYDRIKQAASRVEGIIEATEPAQPAFVDPRFEGADFPGQFGQDVDFEWQDAAAFMANESEFPGFAAQGVSDDVFFNLQGEGLGGVDEEQFFYDDELPPSPGDFNKLAEGVGVDQSFSGSPCDICGEDFSLPGTPTGSPVTPRFTTPEFLRQEYGLPQAVAISQTPRPPLLQPSPKPSPQLTPGRPRPPSPQFYTPPGPPPQRAQSPRTPPMRPPSPSSFYTPPIPPPGRQPSPRTPQGPPPMAGSPGSFYTPPMPPPGQPSDSPGSFYTPPMPPPEQPCSPCTTPISGQGVSPDNMFTCEEGSPDVAGMIQGLSPENIFTTQGVAESPFQGTLDEDVFNMAQDFGDLGDFDEAEGPCDPVCGAPCSSTPEDAGAMVGYAVKTGHISDLGSEYDDYKSPTKTVSKPNRQVLQRREEKYIDYMFGDDPDMQNILKRAIILASDVELDEPGPYMDLPPSPPSPFAGELGDDDLFAETLPQFERVSPPPSKLRRPQFAAGATGARPPQAPPAGGSSIPGPRTGIPAPGGRGLRPPQKVVMPGAQPAAAPPCGPGAPCGIAAPPQRSLRAPQQIIPPGVKAQPPSRIIAPGTSGIVPPGAKSQRPASRMAPPGSRIQPPGARTAQAGSRLPPPQSRIARSGQPQPRGKPTAGPAPCGGPCSTGIKPPGGKGPSKMQPPASRIQPPGSRMQPPGSRIQPPGSRIQPPGSRIQPPGSRIQPPGSRIQPPGSRIQPPGSRIQPPGSRIRPPGAKAPPPPPAPWQPKKPKFPPSESDMRMWEFLNRAPDRGPPGPQYFPPIPGDAAPEWPPLRRGLMDALEQHEIDDIFYDPDRPLLGARNLVIGKTCNRRKIIPRYSGPKVPQYRPKIEFTVDYDRQHGSIEEDSAESPLPQRTYGVPGFQPPPRPVLQAPTTWEPIPMPPGPPRPAGPARPPSRLPPPGSGLRPPSQLRPPRSAGAPPAPSGMPSRPAGMPSRPAGPPPGPAGQPPRPVGPPPPSRLQPPSQISKLRPPQGSKLKPPSQIRPPGMGIMSTSTPTPAAGKPPCICEGESPKTGLAEDASQFGNLSPLQGEGGAGGPCICPEEAGIPAGRQEEAAVPGPMARPSGKGFKPAGSRKVQYPKQVPQGSPPPPEIPWWEVESPPKVLPPFQPPPRSSSPSPQGYAGFLVSPRAGPSTRYQPSPPSTYSPPLYESPGAEMVEESPPKFAAQGTDDWQELQIKTGQPSPPRPKQNLMDIAKECMKDFEDELAKHAILVGDRQMKKPTPLFKPEVGKQKRKPCGSGRAVRRVTADTERKQLFGTNTGEYLEELEERYSGIVPPLPPEQMLPVRSPVKSPPRILPPLEVPKEILDMVPPPKTPPRRKMVMPEVDAAKDYFPQLSQQAERSVLEASPQLAQSPHTPPPGQTPKSPSPVVSPIPSVFEWTEVGGTMLSGSDLSGVCEPCTPSPQMPSPGARTGGTPRSPPRSPPHSPSPPPSPFSTTPELQAMKAKVQASEGRTGIKRAPPWFDTSTDFKPMRPIKEVVTQPGVDPMGLPGVVQFDTGAFGTGRESPEPGQRTPYVPPCRVVEESEESEGYEDDEVTPDEDVSLPMSPGMLQEVFHTSPPPSRTPYAIVTPPKPSPELPSPKGAPILDEFSYEDECVCPDEMGTPPPMHQVTPKPSPWLTPDRSPRVSPLGRPIFQQAQTDEGMMSYEEPYVFDSPTSAMGSPGAAAGYSPESSEGELDEMGLPTLVDLYAQHMAPIYSSPTERRQQRLITWADEQQARPPVMPQVCRPINLEDIPAPTGPIELDTRVPIMSMPPFVPMQAIPPQLFSPESPTGQVDLDEHQMSPMAGYAEYYDQSPGGSPGMAPSSPITPPQTTQGWGQMIEESMHAGAMQMSPEYPPSPQQSPCGSCGSPGVAWTTLMQYSPPPKPPESPVASRQPSPRQIASPQRTPPRPAPPSPQRSPMTVRTPSPRMPRSPPRRTPPPSVGGTPVHPSPRTPPISWSPIEMPELTFRQHVPCAPCSTDSAPKRVVQQVSHLKRFVTQHPPPQEVVEELQRQLADFNVCGSPGNRSDSGMEEDDMDFKWMD